MCVCVINKKITHVGLNVGDHLMIISQVLLLMSIECLGRFRLCFSQNAFVQSVRQGQIG